MDTDIHMIIRILTTRTSQIRMTVRIHGYFRICRFMIQALMALILTTLLVLTPRTTHLFPERIMSFRIAISTCKKAGVISTVPLSKHTLVQSTTKRHKILLDRICPIRQIRRTYTPHSHPATTLGMTTTSWPITSPITFPTSTIIPIFIMVTRTKVIATTCEVFFYMSWLWEFVRSLWISLHWKVLAGYPWFRGRDYLHAADSVLRMDRFRPDCLAVHRGADCGKRNTSCPRHWESTCAGHCGPR